MVYPQRTANGLNTMECISAMQKCIRRSMEREAMEFACEMIHSADSENGSRKKWWITFVCNRLELIAHEDIDIFLSPHVIPFVRACVGLAKEQWNPDNPAKSRHGIGNAIRMMCRSPKSRESCHFQAAIGFRSWTEGYVPTIPDWAVDQHTIRGRQLGLGMDHFRDEGAKLIEPDGWSPLPDAYQDEAFQRWAVRDGNAASEPNDGVRHAFKGKVIER